MNKSHLEAVPPELALEKLPTGIEGFDQITGGGLPKGRMTLVMGGPGCGKTIFALQTLVNGARNRAERGIFVTFEENPRQIIANAATFGWDIPALEKKELFFLDACLAPETVVAGNFDLTGLLAGVKAKAEKAGAKWIVFDGIDMLLTLLDNPAAERQEIHRLHQWLLESGLTGLMTAKSHQGDALAEERYDFMQYMVDCSIVLKHHHIDNIAVRGIRVIKYRGSAFSANEDALIIGPDGMDVFSLPSTSMDYAVSSERLSTGIPRLDTMLEGGYFRKATVLISGAPGTAKTTLAGAFALAACRKEERTLFVSFDENASEIVRNLSSVGIHLGPYLEKGNLHIHSARSESQSAEEHKIMVKRMIRETKPTCLILDPLSAMAKAGGRARGMEVARRLIGLAKVEGITTICTNLLDSNARDESMGFDISQIADTWIHLSYLVQSGERNRALTIVKSRGTRHSNQVRELILSDEGITLQDVYSAGGEVLVGTARWETETAETSRREQRRMETETKRRQMVRAEKDIVIRMDALQKELEVARDELNWLTSKEETQENVEVENERNLNRLRGADEAVTNGTAVNKNSNSHGSADEPEGGPK
jgi:circadian clock protein KaiC